MHPEQRALLDGIIAHQDDDVRRGVYADWLEEHEEGDICPHCDGTGENEFLTSDNEIEVRDCSQCNGTGGTSNKFAKRAAYIREHLQNPQSSQTVSKHGVEVVWRRGFIAEVRCTMANWQRYGLDACRKHPIEWVAITDKEPLSVPPTTTGVPISQATRLTRYMWSSRSRVGTLDLVWVLPIDIFPPSVGGGTVTFDFDAGQFRSLHKSSDEARDWLSRRCIETARAKIANEVTA